MKKIFDLHNDFLTEIKSDRLKSRYLSSKKASFAEDIISAVWTSEMDRVASMQAIESAFDFIRFYNKTNNKSLHLAIEDFHFYTKSNLEQIINMKPIYCGLTWNHDNILAGGAMDGGDLTELGIEVVRELESAEIQVDTAHLSEKSFMAFSRVTEKPILCSHTAVSTLRGHRRNLKDYQIKMIVESGGLLGIALVGDFLTEEKSVKIGDVARHIDYVVSRFGDKNICLGTDFYGTKKLPKGINSYKDLILLEERLKYLGYDDETIDNIFYKNAQEFFKSSDFSPLI